MIERDKRKKIEFAFRHYNVWMKEISAKTESITEAGTCSKMAAASGGGRFLPESKFSTMVEKMVDTPEYRWCQIIEKTYEYYRLTGKDTLIDLRYFSVRRMSEYSICDRLHISRTALFAWIDDIIGYALRWAIKYGLLEP